MTLDLHKAQILRAPKDEPQPDLGNRVSDFSYFSCREACREATFFNQFTLLKNSQKGVGKNTPTV